MTLHVDSEVGRLRQVILHRPDLELKRLTPTNKDDCCSTTCSGSSARSRSTTRSPSGSASWVSRSISSTNCCARRWQCPRRGGTSSTASFDERVYGPMATDASQRLRGLRRRDPRPSQLIGGMTKREFLERIPEPKSHGRPRDGPGRLPACRRCPTICSPGTPRPGSTTGSRSTRCDEGPQARDGALRGHLPLAPAVRRRRLPGLVGGVGQRPRDDRGRRRARDRQRRRADRDERADHAAGRGAARGGLFAAGSGHEIVALDMPKARAFMHLDTVMTMVERGHVHEVRGAREPPVVHHRARRHREGAQGHRPPGRATCTGDRGCARPRRDQRAHRHTGRELRRAGAVGRRLQRPRRRAGRGRRPTSAT